MSKKWKIAIGGVIAAVVVAGVALAAWGAVTFRSRVYERGWQPGVHKWGPEAATQLRRPEPRPEQSRRVVEGAVRLVDDDGDGVPDRGVIEVPEDLQPGWGHGPLFLRRGSRWAMPFGFAQDKLRGGPQFGHGFGSHFGRVFVPFFIVGGLFRLAFLALLIGLGVACFRCWKRTKEAGEPQRG